MDENPCQKVLWSHVPMKEIDLININKCLNEGYEISDIAPYMSESGGAIYVAHRGLYITGLLFILSPSNKKSILHYHGIARDNRLEFVGKINEITRLENQKGWLLYKIFPGTAIVEPMNGNGLGKGTQFFCLLYIGSQPQVV